MEKVDLHSKIFLGAAAEHEWMKTEWISCLIILYCGEAVEPLSDLRYRLLINKVLQRLKLCHQLQDVQQNMSSVHLSQSCYGCTDITLKSVL